MAGVNYDYELNNGWDKWQNLVLTAMKENRDAILAMDNKVDDVRLNMATLAERQENVIKQAAAVEALAHATDSRVNAIEVSRSRSMGFAKGAWAIVSIIGASLLSVAGIVIGLISLYAG